MFQRLSILTLVSSVSCWVVLAGPITYQVTVNTSPIQGTGGSVDFNFNPGPLVSQAASVQILNFTTNGTLANNALVIGDVTGTLPSTVSLNNTGALNDYFEGFTYGTTLQFSISLFGPALSSPNGVATSGSTFAFSMFSDPNGTIPVLTTDTTNGFAYTVNVNLDGSTSAASFVPTSSPEPLSLGLLLVGLALLCFGWGKAARQKG